MAIGIIGKKIGMTRLFGEDGRMLPVTVVQAEPNRVVQIKRDGYAAVQVTNGSVRPERMAKPLAGHYAKAQQQPGRMLHEFRIGVDQLDQYTVGTEIKVDAFAAGQYVDVRATTIGKGFAGVMKRHHFRGGRKSHGNSLSHRAPGSIGQRQTPGRVFPGKKMAGHMGQRRRTIQNIRQKNTAESADCACR